MVDGIIYFLARPHLIFFHGGQGQAATRLPAMSEISSQVKPKEKRRGQGSGSGIRFLKDIRANLYDESALSWWISIFSAIF
jgi:hypothetical protein